MRSCLAPGLKVSAAVPPAAPCRRELLYLEPIATLEQTGGHLLLPGHTPL